MSILVSAIAAALLSGCQASDQWALPQQQPVEQTPLTQLSDQRLAQIAQQSGDFKTSVQLYRKLVQEQPNNGEFLYALANIYRQTKQPNLSINLIASKLVQGTGAQVSPTWLPKLSQVLGLSYLDVANYGQAKRTFQQSLQQFAELGNDKQLESEFNLAVSHNGIGVAASWLQQETLATQSFRQALSFEPENIKFSSNLSLSLITQKQYQQAAALLTPLYRQGRTSARMRLHLALALIKLDQPAQARQVLKQDLSELEIEQNIQYFQIIGGVEQLTELSLAEQEQGSK